MSPVSPLLIRQVEKVFLSPHLTLDGPFFVIFFNAQHFRVEVLIVLVLLLPDAIVLRVPFLNHCFTIGLIAFDSLQIVSFVGKVAAQGRLHSVQVLTL